MQNLHSKRMHLRELSLKVASRIYYQYALNMPLLHRLISTNPICLILCGIFFFNWSLPFFSIQFLYSLSLDSLHHCTYLRHQVSVECIASALLCRLIFLIVLINRFILIGCFFNAFYCKHAGNNIECHFRCGNLGDAVMLT